jgi:diaminohydroxyphosphoribosylaminopyrimidine deaminase/5-amino-6-(5-phosphoribosylamino)uracil reductase
MVGIETVRKDNPSLTTRLNYMKGVDPTRIILDTHLSIPIDAKVLTIASNAKTWVVCGHDVDKAKKSAVIQKGARVIEVNHGQRHIDLNMLMDQLARENITSLLIEGGGQVIGSALATGIVDKLCFFYAPKILGGDDGIPICSGVGPKMMKDSIKVKQLYVHRLGDDVMIEGYIN